MPDASVGSTALVVVVAFDTIVYMMIIKHNLYAEPALLIKWGYEQGFLCQ